MAANSLLAGAVQMLCVIAWRGGKGANSELLAKSLNTNPVVVRRILKTLENHGLVKVRPGRHGGVELLRSPADITLEDVYKAVEPDAALFALRERGNQRCPVNNAMIRTLPPLFGAADAAVDNVLRRTKIASLVEKII
ncbi:MAG TPA: Rrf2 family transcriptional regulator [Xanthobacteraceae bacterium]